MNKLSEFVLSMVLLAGFSLICPGDAKAQSPADILSAAQKANDYFMSHWPDPTEPTFVGRMRESNLWTRAVYYEGLMALHSIDPQQRYIDYAMQWSDFHKWQARGGTESTNADNQCCQQTYIDLHRLTGKGTLEPTRENLDHQIATGSRIFIDAHSPTVELYENLVFGSPADKACRLSAGSRRCLGRSHGVPLPHLGHSGKFGNLKVIGVQLGRCDSMR